MTDFLMRAPEAGTPIRGTVNYVLTALANGLTGFRAVSIPTADPARLSNEIYVDQGTTAATPDGSMNAPFPTMQEGLDAIAALDLSVTQAVLYVAGYNYEAEGALTLDAGGKNSVTIQCNEFVPAATFRGRGLLVTAQVRIAGLTVINCGTVTLNGVDSTAQVSVDSALICEGCIVTDFVSTNDSLFMGCLLFEGDCSQSISLENCQVGAGGELRVGSTAVNITGTMVGYDLDPGTCAIVFQGDPGIVSLDNFSIYLPGTTTPNWVLTNGTFHCPGVSPAAAFVYYFRYNGTADGTFFAGPSGQGTPVSNEGQGSLVAVRAGTLRNLRIHCFNGVISNAAVAFTVRVNGADTGITVTMNPGDTDATDLVNTAALAAGDFVSVGVVGGVNANTPAYTAIAFELV